MANPSGFLEYIRQAPGKQPVAERLQHYGEFTKMYDTVELHHQSARCMDCGVPFCHNGCPLGNIIPEFNDAVYRGRWQEAYEILASTNNFPEFTGRICPAPCESACVLGINQPPVAIEEIEKHIVEIAFERGLVKARRIFHRTGKKVAVVGSGPAGLAAAAQLNAAGHSVTVFERDDAPGGLLRYGIPDFKLEKWVVDRRIALMEAEGVEFRCSTEVGSAALPAGDLFREYHAVVLCIGSTIPRDLPAPGRDVVQGVHFAMDFLKQQNKRVRAGQPFDLEKTAISAKGKHVVVIGGGDTGSDCVGTSNRQGAASVTQFELLPEPPKDRAAYMPWPTYPMLYKVTTSHEEGCERRFAVQTKAFVGDENGQLRALRIVDLEWAAGLDGRPSSFVEVPGSEREIPCELALLAMGFLHPQQEGLLAQLELATDARKNISAPEHSYQTNIPRVFCAGDARRGQSLVVWAIQEGRECARSVDAYLRK
ncbi:MAG TPA: glutamate synthase subunit beta [Saprospiraceae bacterium]|nr:glutamate synthase subunit beta [Saprospiraceae bacterium]